MQQSLVDINAQTIVDVFMITFVLLQYSVALAIIIILQIVAGIVGLVYRDNAQEKFEEKYNNKLMDAILDYSKDKSAKRTLDYLQNEVH